jgi:hypothetical protein
VQVRRLDNDQVMWATPADFSSTAYTSLHVEDFQEGPALVTVFVNGIPSVSKILVVNDMFNFYLPMIIKH